MIQCPYFILILALVAHTYTIHTCIYTVYIPILYLFYTRILYFYSVLYFNQKHIPPKPPSYTRLVSTLMGLCGGELLKISRALVDLELRAC